MSQKLDYTLAEAVAVGAEISIYRAIKARKPLTALRRLWGGQ